MANHPYPTRPRWNGEGLAPMPDVAVNIGYDVVAPRFPASRREHAYTRANATINDNHYQWPMFIHDVSIDLALAGSTAQGRTTRDFYPRNFTQPGFTIQGQALDQQDYGVLCEFLHHAQRTALSEGRLLQLWVNGGGLRTTQGSNKGVKFNENFYPNRRLRGVHKPILCQGYIGSMPRVHTKHVPSPLYSFEFFVSVMLIGPYTETQTDIQYMTDWVALLQGGSYFQVTKQLLQENQKILNWAAANSVNIISDPQPSDGSASSSAPVHSYVNPVGNWDAGQIDEGVDGTIHSDYVAPGDSRIVVAQAKGAGAGLNWPGGLVCGKLLNGPQQGKVWYVGEEIIPKVRVGQHVDAGTTVAAPGRPDPRYANGSIETGWMDPNNVQQPLAITMGFPAVEGGMQTTAAGMSFNRWLTSLGAPGGRKISNVVGTVPSGYP